MGPIKEFALKMKLPLRLEKVPSCDGIVSPIEVDANAKVPDKLFSRPNSDGKDEVNELEYTTKV